MGEVARAAKLYRLFPKKGSVENVRKRMNSLGIAEADVFEQIGDAERCWLSQ
ncbi:hypothetical protein Q4F19_07845 [Sphingomonas sp. BIUV-7]|uniref:Uncharacterized protein n=1 Tax=Sphingomonas natans TaxID=3063330 RepID=A0ABT8Y7I6_9SPHN|nr:hypothetical protein [Sphingomonas sp. BIUV-7]MDO6414292.1 hypothetical protein [Sphingomonas sp. BIUV-7]